jgi:hypothetical protein
MPLTYLIITPNHDQPIDLMDDEDYVCTFDPTDDEVTESLDDAINATFKQLWA